MTTLPLMFAKTATSLIVSFTTNATTNADLNNDGVVDTTDLIALSSTMGTSCEGECPTDLNQDGIVDSADLMELMGQWGAVPGYVSQDTQPTVDDTNTTRDPNRDMSWQGKAPVLLDAIYFDQYTRLFSHGGYARWNNAEQYNQGEFTQAWTQENNVAVQPMVYGSVDWDHDNTLTEEDKANFIIWLDEYVPADYDGPLCLDLEGQYWATLDTTNQSVMDTVLDVYIEQLKVAQSLRPNAKIGFWGLPKKSHTDSSFNTASIDRLLSECTALFPDVYEWNPGGNDSARLQLHVERAIAMVNGEIPVYAQTSPRYKTTSTGPRLIHNTAEFMRDQVQSSLNAAWTDADGKEHRVQGVSFWDAYTYVATYTEGWSEMSMDERKAAWDELDYTHIEFLEGMKSMVDAAASTFITQTAEAPSINSNESDQTTEAIDNTTEVATTNQNSVLVRTVQTFKATLALTTSQYKKSTKSYRSAKRAWTQARRSFASATRKYSKGTSQYQRAYEAYQTAEKEMQHVSKELREDRNEYRNARATLNQAKEQWKSAEKDSPKAEEVEQVMFASK